LFAHVVLLTYKGGAQGEMIDVSFDAILLLEKCTETSESADVSFDVIFSLVTDTGH
jgi:hypothetical protein